MRRIRCGSCCIRAVATSATRSARLPLPTARRIAEREHRHLPDRDLAWLSEGTAEFDEYVEGLTWAQDYAALNRRPHGDLVVARAAAVLL